MQFSSKNISSVGRLLGYGGLIPFIGLAGLSFIISSDQRPLVIFNLLAYGVTIISFLGAIHWGLTMVESNPKKWRLLWGVAPSLLGWVSLMLQPDLGLLLVAVTLLLCLIIDYKIYPEYGIGHWLGMRLVLGCVAITSTVLPAAWPLVG